MIDSNNTQNINGKKSTGKDDWESHWSLYSNSASENPAQRYRHRLILNEIQKWLTPGQSLNLLDIGCGQGDLLLKISKRFPEIALAGFELSKSGVQQTLKKVPHATILQEDILHPNADSVKLRGFGDVLCCSEVLEHVDDPKAFLDEISTYCRPQGFLIVTVPGGPMSAFDKHIGHRQHFNQKSLRELIATTKNLQTVKIYSSGFPFFNLYRLIVILRGSKLKNDVQSGESGHQNWFASLVMRVFHPLFYLNLLNSSWGWQMMAVLKIGK